MNKIEIENIRRNRNFSQAFGQVIGDFHLLGQGEYNINYLFYSKKYGQDLVLRVATDSQMKLENQIAYEYEALKILEKSGRTPKVYYYEGDQKILGYGFLVMEYLPGRPLDYKTDLSIGAHILADIHNQKPGPDNKLICPENPLEAIYEESLSMFKKYDQSDLADPEVRRKIQALLEKGKNIKGQGLGSRTIINSELNSGNFLINPEATSYLIDWEKPIFAYPAQDLGHFLAPTTTFWKTDHILNQDEVAAFLTAYCQRSQEHKDEKLLWTAVRPYIAINCLRGITWCAMAYIDYQDSDKLIVNIDTYHKIQSYLSLDFLERIERDYLYDQ